MSGVVYSSPSMIPLNHIIHSSLSNNTHCPRFIGGLGSETGDWHSNDGYLCSLTGSFFWGLLVGMILQIFTFGHAISLVNW